MPPKNTRLVIRWPSAAVFIAGIASVAAVYVLVPEHREGIALGVAAVFAILLAFMRRILGVGPALALLLAIAVPGMQGCATAPTVGDVARTGCTAARISCAIVDAVCPVVETAGGESP